MNSKLKEALRTIEAYCQSNTTCKTCVFKLDKEGERICLFDITDPYEYSDLIECDNSPKEGVDDDGKTV